MAGAPIVGVRRWMNHYLSPLLAPQSVALVGASDRVGSLGRTVFENLLSGQFKGDIYAVNPHHRSVFGRRAFEAGRAPNGVPTGRGTPAKPWKCNNMLRSGQVRSRRAARQGWARLDSNQRPRDYESPALTA